MKVYKFFLANYPKKTEVVRKQFTDAEWKKIENFLSQPGKTKEKQ